MWAPDPDRRSALGVAALMIVGAVAGFIVAEPAASRQYQTLETVGSDSQAYAVDLSEPKRMRFVVEADEAQDPDSPAPEANFHVYDPSDAHFASFHLEGDGDDATALADRAGAWVVYVTDAERAQLAIQVEGEDGSSSQVRSLEVSERSWTVATADGGAVDQDLALRMDRRPAQAYLDVDGTAEDLDASAVSEDGVVHSYENVDATADGQLVNGSQSVEPDNIAAGTYQVEAQAASLNGTLSLVAESYERTQPVQDPEAPETNGSAPEAPTSDNIVAEVGEDQAVDVAPQGADRIAFEVAEDVRGKVYLYNASDDLVQTVSIGDQEQDSQDRPDNHSVDRATAKLATDENVAIYVAYLNGQDGWDDDEEDHGRQVTVRLPGVEDARSASNLTVKHDKVTVEGENSTASFDISGGLVQIGARSDGWTWDSGDVTVEGPRGVVLESSDREYDGGGWFGGGYETYPERFSDGTFDVTVEEDGGFGFGESETKVKYGYLAE